MQRCEGKAVGELFSISEKIHAFISHDEQLFKPKFRLESLGWHISIAGETKIFARFSLQHAYSVLHVY